MRSEPSLPASFRGAFGIAFFPSLRAAGLAVATVAFVACSQSPSVDGQPAASAPVAASPAVVALPTTDPAAPSKAHGPVITTIVTHDTKVSIVGHGGDLRVVVKKTDGTLVADGVTLDELKVRDAETWELVKNATVRDGDGAFVDATNDQRRGLRPAPGAAPRGTFFDATMLH